MSLGFLFLAFAIFPCYYFGQGKSKNIKFFVSSEVAMPRLNFALGLFIAFIATAVFAQNPPIPDGDPLTGLWEIVKNWKDMTPLAIGIGLVVLVGQVVKTFLDDEFKYKRLLIAVLSVVYAAAYSISSGSTILSALVLAFLTNGGAKWIYEEIKGIWDISQTIVGKILDAILKATSK
jgi:hypothetical protein